MRIQYRWTSLRSDENRCGNVPVKNLTELPDLNEYNGGIRDLHRRGPLTKFHGIKSEDLNEVGCSWEIRIGKNGSSR